MKPSKQTKEHISSPKRRRTEGDRKGPEDYPREKSKMKMNRLRQKQGKAEIGISSWKEITGWVQEGISQGFLGASGGAVFMVVMLISCGVRIPDRAE